MLSFEPLRKQLREKNISIYVFEKKGIIGKATTTVLRTDNGNVNTSTINALCRYLNCQPSDIIEYIPDDEG